MHESKGSHTGHTVKLIDSRIVELKDSKTSGIMKLIGEFCAKKQEFLAAKAEAQGGQELDELIDCYQSLYAKLEKSYKGSIKLGGISSAWNDWLKETLNSGLTESKNFSF